MKKILNGLGVFGSIILTLVLSVLIFLYVIVLNVKFVVSEKGMANTFKKIDVVETLKAAEDGMVWEEFTELAESLDLSEEQFEQILNNDKVKEQVGGYIGEVLGSIFNENEVNLTKEDIENFLNTAVNEYNKISDVKISETMRKEIINSIDEEMINDMNEELASINLVETVASEYVEYVKLIDNLLFGSYTLIMLALIILIIGLIALFRFSCYKWMSYVKISTIINGSLMLIIGLFILFFPLEDMEIILPLRNLIVTRIFITSAILFIVSIGLSYGKKYLEKYIDKKKDVATKEESNIVNERIEEVKQVEEKKKKGIDKKIIIIIVLVLILILVILFIIFRGNGSYTITFDTNGGTEVTAIEVKNNEIVKLPEAPEKDGYIFVGWVDEDGNEVTKDTIVNENMTIKAIWKELYTCPSGCTPIGDGSKCTKITTKDIVTYTGCSEGTETIEKFCSAHKSQVAVGFDEDISYVSAGIMCNDNATGFCVDYNSRYTINGSSCPSGYTQNGNICEKTETITCTAN